MTWPDLTFMLYRELSATGVQVLIALVLAAACFLCYLYVRLFEAKANNGLLPPPAPPRRRSERSRAYSGKSMANDRTPRTASKSARRRQKR